MKAVFYIDAKLIWRIYVFNSTDSTVSSAAREKQSHQVHVLGEEMRTCLAYRRHLIYSNQSHTVKSTFCRLEREGDFNFSTIGEEVNGDWPSESIDDKRMRSTLTPWALGTFIA